MSSSESTTGQGLSIKSIVNAGNDLISPQGERESPSIAQNIAESTGRFKDAIFSAAATTIDAPLGIVNAGVALPFNALGLVSRLGDRALSHPIDKTRAGIRKVLLYPVNEHRLSA